MTLYDPHPPPINAGMQLALAEAQNRTRDQEHARIDAEIMAGDLPTTTSLITYTYSDINCCLSYPLMYPLMPPLTLLTLSQHEKQWIGWLPRRLSLHNRLDRTNTHTHTHTPGIRVVICIFHPLRTSGARLTLIPHNPLTTYLSLPTTAPGPAGAAGSHGRRGSP